MGLVTRAVNSTPPAAARGAPSSPASGGRRRAASASTSTAPTEAWPTRACPAAACCPRSMFVTPIAASSCAQIPRSALWPAAGGVTQRCRRSARGVCACALGYRREHACRPIRCRQRDTRPGNNPQSPLHTSAAASALIARAPMRRRRVHVDVCMCCAFLCVSACARVCGPGSGAAEAMGGRRRRARVGRQASAPTRAQLDCARLAQAAYRVLVCLYHR